MTTPQGPVPPPPRNYANWLDKIVSKDWNGNDCVAANHARVELAALRKELEQARDRIDVIEPAYVNAIENLDIARSVAKKELEKLAKELADTKGDLLAARQNLLQLDALRWEKDQITAERDKAIQERDMLIAEGVAITDDLITAVHEGRQERDDLRAQVAELREAMLGLGELGCTYGDGYRLYLAKLNAHVAKLRAASKEEQQP